MSVVLFDKVVVALLVRHHDDEECQETSLELEGFEIVVKLNSPKDVNLVYYSILKPEVFLDLVRTILYAELTDSAQLNLLTCQVP